MGEAEKMARASKEVEDVETRLQQRINQVGLGFTGKSARQPAHPMCFRRSCYTAIDCHGKNGVRRIRAWVRY